jgi:hypothetical protein
LRANAGKAARPASPASEPLSTATPLHTPATFWSRPVVIA